MKRRLFTILYGLSFLLVIIMIIVMYALVPLWFIVWIFTGWWAYPPASALANNIMAWVMVRSTTKSFITGEYYKPEDYSRLREPLNTQEFNVL